MFLTESFSNSLNEDQRVRISKSENILFSRISLGSDKLGLFLSEEIYLIDLGRDELSEEICEYKVFKV